jgi:predicted nuclease of predicted toxin-antitoxin system
LIVDECLAESTKEILRKKGFELQEIEEILNQSATDKEIFEFATEKSIAIITHDRGFGEIHHTAKKRPSLIIILEMLSPYQMKQIIYCKRVLPE